MNKDNRSIREIVNELHDSIKAAKQTIIVGRMNIKNACADMQKSVDMLESISLKNRQGKNKNVRL